MPASRYLQNKWLNHTFGNSTFTQPSEWWVQLHYGDPGVNCTNSAWSAAGRAQLTDFTAAGSSVARQNASDESATWPDLPDPSGVLTEVTYISIWDAETLGNPLTYGETDDPIPVSLHGSIVFNAGDITNTVT